MIIDFKNFTFTAEQIRDINELVFDNILHAPELSSIHTMYSGIVYDKEIGFITEGGLVGKAGQGCDGEPQDWSIGTRKVVWEPKSWEIFLKECYKQLESTAAVYALNKHTRVSDLTDTDYMTIVVEVLTEAVKKFLYRLIWFNDTEAQNAPTGIITQGVDLGYFNIINGLFKQIEIALANDATLGVTISANAESTKVAQMSGLTPEMAYSTLSEMYYKAPVAMRSGGNLRFLVTQSVADAYQQYLIGKGIESTYKNMVEGVPTLSFLGIEVVPMPIWDEMIQAYNDLGDTFYKPHRALLVEQANLAVGTPAEEVYGDFDIWYDKTSKNNYIRLEDKLDAKLLNDKRFIFAG